MGLIPCDPARASMRLGARALGLERSEASGEAPAVRRERVFYVRLAETMEPDLYGSKQVSLPNRLELEDANFCTALSGARAGLRRTKPQTVLGLWMYWSMYGHVEQGNDVLESLLR